jgi:hypothetical protein
MDPTKRLVLLVEGEGDVAAVPHLVKYLLNEIDPPPWDCLFLDKDVMRVGSISSLTGKKESEWARFIGVARRRARLGGILLLLDGDILPAGHRVFCPGAIGRDFSRRARTEGAGVLFSLASVFAMQEYESWLIGGVESLAGKRLPGDRAGILAGTVAPSQDIEKTIRGGKQWLGRHMEARSYKETLDQEPLTQLLLSDLAPLRQRGMSSFLRLERAIRQLVEAIRTGNHVVTPANLET